MFDIDGTIFRNSLLIELHWKMVKAGIVPKSAITKLDRHYWRWVRRQGSYDRYLQEVIESFSKFTAGQRTADIKALARRVVQGQGEIVYRYTRSLVERLRKTHLLIAISGSPREIVEEFARAWKFDHMVGTQYEVKGRRYTGKLQFIAAHHKREALQGLIDRYGLSLKGSVGVGDTESDAGVFELVDHPICFNPTAELYKLAKKKGWKVVVERKNMIYHL